LLNYTQTGAQNDHYSSTFYSQLVSDSAYGLCACAEQFEHHYGVDAAEPVAERIAVTNQHY
jgi:hypothetical protein